MKHLSTWLLCALVSSTLSATDASITIDVDKPGVTVSPLLWGIFFEDINLSADGGIYAELVRNRSFEDSKKPEHWLVTTDGSSTVDVVVDKKNPLSEKNPHSLKVTVAGAGSGGVANDGYYGMSLIAGEQYQLSLFARGGSGFSGPLHIRLVSASGTVYAQESLPSLTDTWKNYTAQLTANTTDPKSRLVISTDKPGTFWLDMVSLFPQKTWKGHGFRIDLCEKLQALKPSFMRFPGGCWVEGDTMKEAYRWKQTIGDIAERRTQKNIWGYQATHGLGFHEYLVLSEDLGAEPLFCINVGMSHRENVPMDHMQPYVQDALDAIEYANGPVDSTWGAIRAKAGHPAPFNLRYLEIGNENGGQAYSERYALFHDAILARYPTMRLIANEWHGMPKCRAIDILDEHYYNTPEFFIQKADLYDHYDRQAHKIFVGEYAVTKGTGEGSLRGAIGEAAFMTGLERNADVVLLASYAPLFVNINHRRWNPNLINFDSSRVYGIPSYYVQKMFSDNRGHQVLPVEVASTVGAVPLVGMVGVGTWNTQAEFKDIRVTSGEHVLYASDFSQGMTGWTTDGGTWAVHDGALQQSSLDSGVHAVIGNTTWSNYSFHTKARKISGQEGFLISFGLQHADETSWWNLGGWNNSRYVIQMPHGMSEIVPGQIETGRWYDIQVDVRGSTVSCLLDGKLINTMSTPVQKPLQVSATLTDQGTDVIVKIVNSSHRAVVTDLQLHGVHSIVGTATMQVLTADDPMAENSIKEPTKIIPVTSTITCAPSFTREFPANSLTVLRIPVGE